MHDWYTDYKVTIGSNRISSIEVEYATYESILLEYCPDIAYLCQYILSQAGRNKYVKEI